MKLVVEQARRGISGAGRKRPAAGNDCGYARRPKGDYVQKNQGDKPSWFAIGRGFEGNVLLKAFHQGMEVREGVKVWIRSDSFKS
jgi:hypothetical protein